MSRDDAAKFNLMIVAHPAAVEADCKRILAGWSRYKAVEKLTGVPAALIGVLHDREASCDFRGCLANGDWCIGNGRRTRHDPAGLGPYGTWEDSAVDALRHEGLLGITDWNIGAQLWAANKFNGFGYEMHGFANPYLWGGTQWYTHGKYTSDRHYDFNAVDPQIGVAPILARLAELTHATLKAPPVVLKPAANDNPAAKPKLSPQDHKAVVQHSRALRWQEWYANFCKYLGLSGASLGTLIPTIGNFLTDWRTLTVAGVLGGAWIMSEMFKYNLLSAAAAGRYIPSGFFNVGQPAMADGPTLSVAPPSAETEAPAPDTAGPTSVPPPSPTDPALVQGLGQPAVQIEQAA